LNIISKFFNTLADFILPQDCILCGKETPGSLMCDVCLEYLPAVRSPFCYICGRPASDKNLCRYCSSNTSLDHGRAWLCFIPPVNTLIHHYKYRKKTRLATILGRAMATIIQSDQLLQQADMIAPIPLFWFKRLHRGYNQASILCDVIAANTHIPQHNILRRTRYTRTQTQLLDKHRRRNVTGAFTVTTDNIAHKKVLLIDDVLTTGATANECARVLKQAGAAEVYTCVAAITP
jgi:competence protein ComFC